MTKLNKKTITRISEQPKISFYNQVMNRGTMRQMIGRLVSYLGNNCTAQILDQLKTLGFRYATQTGISLGIDDLLTTPSKAWLIQDAEHQAQVSIDQCRRGSIHAVEKLRQVVETWHVTSEHLKHEMSPNFKITDPLNPVHMMSFSGARGSASQVHQLVGMRGLMSDPQGQIIDLPIQSNLREGLSLTEYIISCYGARKGVVDTAIRTADAGYLTRRLVEVAQHVVVRNFDCGTKEGIHLDPIRSYSTSGLINLSLQERLIGRVVAQTLNINARCIITRNQDIGAELANRLSIYKHPNLLIRSPLTCSSMPKICQLCYGWDLSYGNLVELGEAIGIVAGQSIGEPGTQLTLRTFHTGGVFSGDVAEHVRAPFNGIVDFDSTFLKPTRNRHGRPAWICCNSVSVTIQGKNQNTTLNVPVHSFLLVRKQQYVESRQIIAEVRAATPPLKEQVSKGTYSDIQGEIYFHKTFYSILNPLLRKVLTLTPRYTKYIWVLSCQLLTTSCSKKTYILYRDQDHIQIDLPLGLSLNKSREKKKIVSNQIGLLYTSRYNMSNINQQMQYQWLLIVSPTDQFRVTSSLIDNQKFNTSCTRNDFQSSNQTRLKSISFFVSDTKLFNDKNKFEKKNRDITHLNSILFEILKIKQKYKNNTFSSNVGLKGLLGRPYKLYKPAYILSSHLHKISVHLINYQVNPQLFKQQVDLKINSTRLIMFYEAKIYNRCFLRIIFHPISDLNHQTFVKTLFIESNLGKFVSQGMLALYSKVSLDSARIVTINNSYCILQLSKSYLTISKSNIYVCNQEPILAGKTLLSLIYERLRTSDITQGLPKAEQLLEARPNNEVGINLQQYFEDWTKRIKKYLILPYSLFTAKLVKHSQIDLVNRIQAVYLAQGVFTSDKHIEVIVRQMTSKVLIVEHIDPTAISPEGVIRWSSRSKTHKMCLYLPGELIDLIQAQRIHRALQEPIPYRPLLLGVTKACLNTESFISEASFERTANVLSKSAFEGRIDWMKGLKENIIFGGVIPAGTGCPEQYWDSLFKEIQKMKYTIYKPFLEKK
uniref:DNA-directed RNA polymerase subunit beta'' n=1 Tax=Spirogyra maxima TaxID=3180 RepID=A0A191T4K0_SPIMX|nr:beta'' subunit of RNA polymerase [Spirogyra maxima]ANI25319.1 beta'' subunit of RNA polymerase [Spirogyra maxima]